MEEYLVHSGLRAFKRAVSKGEGIIKDALSLNLNWYLSCSFGKDSICLLDMIAKQKPGITVLHMDSGYCLPETYDVRKYYSEKFNINLTILKSDIDYFDLMTEYGMPGINRTSSQQVKVVNMIKKKRGFDWMIENGFTGVFLGLRKEESRHRGYILNIKSPTYQVENKTWRCCPLANWTDKDVWAYIFSNNLFYPKFYDYNKFGNTREKIRNSSWCTTDGASYGKIIWLKHYYPNLYLKLLRSFPEVAKYT